MNEAKKFTVIRGDRDARKADEKLHSLDVECRLLASVMIDTTPASAAIARQVGVRPEAFYSAAHRKAWEIIETLVARGVVPTSEAVALEITNLGALEFFGGWGGVAALSEMVPTTLQVRDCAEAVKLLWERREAIRIAQELIEKVRDSASREEFVADATGVGHRLLGMGRAGSVRSLAERLAGIEEDIEARSSGREDRSGWINTGIRGFDERLRPLNSAKEDGFIGVAGGSGHGKSALMRQWAGQALLDGRRVLVYSRETSIDGFVEQLVASWVGLDLMNVSQAPRDVVKAFCEKCAWLRDEVADKRLFVYENDPATSLLYVEDLVAHYRNFEHLHGPPDLVLVDYLQILLPNPKGKKCNSREQEVAYVSHSLQAEQRRSGITWVVGAQMNEAGLAAQRQGKRDDKGRLIHRLPIPGDLRESQAFFHDCDRLVAIYRPPEDCRGSSQDGPAVYRPEQWLCQIKRRRGGTGVVKCWFERRFTRFVEFSRAEVLESEQGATATTGQVTTTGVSKEAWKRGRER